MNNFTHPEIKEGEILFTNSNQKGFDMMDWKSKRKGLVAFDGNGLLTNNDDWFPVFIKKDELERSGKLLEDIRREFRILIK